MSDATGGPPPPPPPTPKVAPPPPPPPSSSKVPAPPTGGKSLSDILAKKKAAAEKGSSSTDAFAIARSHQYFQEKNSSGYVGLSNQGATCYLNSLVQTLFMSPEFRTSLYGWRFNADVDTREERCIPLQLQKLFGRLQIGRAAIVETKDLTRSFGWSETDSYQQHDIQELLRKLFEALETSFARGDSTKKTGLINHQYEGTLLDFIECKECGFNRSRRDIFTEVPLVIRDMHSIEEAVASYITPEVLTGSERWSCDQCNKKVDASKGLRFSKLPYFLTLQLKRFDYDMRTWQRIKLNNRVSFPMELDMNNFVVREEGSTDIDYTYDLFSVMIHSGGALGGHYFAFIKSFSSGKWYKFNDASVTEIENAEIELMYGQDAHKITSGTDDEKPKPLNNAAFSTNAYMLMYRRRDASKNNNTAPQPQDIPDYIQEMIAKENEEFERSRAEYIKRRDAVPLSVFYEPKAFSVAQSGDLPEGKYPSVQITMDKHDSLEQTIEAALKGIDSASSRLLKDARLRPFNPETGTKSPSWLETDSSSSLEKLQLTPGKCVFIEVRDSNDAFPDDNVEYVIKVVLYNPSNGGFDAPVDVKVSWRCDLVAFKQGVFEKFGIAPEDQRLFVAQSSSLEAKEVSSPDSSSMRQDLGVVDGSIVHLERCIKSTSGAILESDVLRKFDEERHKIQLNYNLLESREMDQEIAIDKRKSLRDLKMILKDILGLPASEFRLCNGLLAKEFKDENKSLDEAGLYDGSAIFIQKGKPMNVDQLRLRFFLFDENKEQDSQFTELFGEVVDVGCRIEELRGMVFSRHAELLGSQDLIRLREKRGQRASNILFDGKTIKQSIQYLKDGQEIAVQKLTKPEKILPHEIILQTRQWVPSKQEISPQAEELVIGRDATILQLKTLLEHQGIPLEHLRLAKPFLYVLKKKDASNVSTLNWYLDDSSIITGSPWYLQDGDLLLFKDDRDAELVSDEQGGQSAASRPARAAERSLQIFTVYDEQLAIEESLQLNNTDS